MYNINTVTENNTYHINNALNLIKKINQRTQNFSQSGGEKIQPQIITIILEPYLIYNGNEFTNSYLTGIKEIDKIINERIKEDYTGVKDIFKYISSFNANKPTTLEPVNYKFNNGKIELQLRKNNGQPFTKSDYEKINDEIENGADSWMEGNITIYEGPELKKTGYNFETSDEANYSVELGLSIIDILPHLK
ncbi:hypothetical protein H012_gp143 [Acanthamoeba polyphaga moumouvirus]|uniref:Uncharacterized protein n=1 Tax=Acanthamoeba polyphaga moumouvirus TaxID=1269028 RepID=L7RD74_9VIRU|nr:hypothetical protein H012_gp143 [Acanthamoeba polyphaga moumouvirus]AGC02307.1 hypothetical protein Moumou_00789 [Acanthamoeba polyphaga moumouvirus]